MISLLPSQSAYRPFTIRLLDLNYIAPAAPCTRSEDYGSDSSGPVVVITL